MKTNNSALITALVSFGIGYIMGMLVMEAIKNQEAIQHGYMQHNPTAQSLVWIAIWRTDCVNKKKD